MILDIIFPVLSQPHHYEAIAPLIALAVVQGLMGLYQKQKADQELKALHSQKVPSFGETPEMRASRTRANEMAKGGFTPQENAVFQQNLARANNASYNRAMNIAPNQSSAINAGINYANLGALNQHAGQDAALHRQNILYSDKFSQTLQTLSNMNIEKQLQQRLLAEQALGKASQSGLMNIGSAASYAALGASQGGGKSPATTPTVADNPAQTQSPLNYPYTNSVPTAESSTGDYSNIYGDLNNMSALDRLALMYGRKNPLSR